LVVGEYDPGAVVNTPLALDAVACKSAIGAVSQVLLVTS
jgi:hypothetical protein